MNIDLVEVGLTHSVWSSLESTISDVRTGTTKSRMITGSYPQQSNVYKLLLKFLSANAALLKARIYCTHAAWLSALFAQRKQYFDDLKSLIVNCVGIKQWESTFNTKGNIVRLMPDYSSFACLTGEEEFVTIVTATTEMCHRLHITRLHKLNQWKDYLDNTTTVIHNVS